jgi:hypothetical protein
MHEKPSTDFGREQAEPYPLTKEFFERFRVQFREDMMQARFKNDSAKLQELQQQQAELDKILTSLEGGDTKPARIKIASMLRSNSEAIEHDIPDNLTSETHAGAIQRLSGYLIELERKN